MTLVDDYGAQRDCLSEKIRQKCLSCHYGRNTGKIFCQHPQHPGCVGDFGSEWVLRCNHYLKSKESKT